MIKLHAAAMCLVAALVAAPAMARTGDLDDMSKVSVQRLVLEEAKNSAVPPALALAVARVESNFNAQALSSAGARGVMQIMPATGRGEYGVHPDELWDARLNVQIGIDFLGRLIERYDGRWDLALSHYNGGTISGSGANARPLPATRRYVADVMRWHKHFESQQRLWLVAKPATPPADAWQPARTAPRLDDMTPVPVEKPRVEQARVEEVKAPQPAVPTPAPLPRPEVVAEPRPEVVERIVVERGAPWRLRHNPRTVVVWRGPASMVGDDFASDDIEARRQRARHSLDDFGPKVRTIRW
ncbi:MAG: transglycosylase SLT domain-containing protein [Alphaproteobacteria bacterium]